MAEAQEVAIEKPHPTGGKDSNSERSPKVSLKDKGREKLAFIKEWYQDIKARGLKASLYPAKAVLAEATAIQQRLENFPDTQESEDNIRAEIRKTEAKLGIQTDAQRTLEASLFIDPAFMRVVQLRGDEYPEEAFGIKSWKGWVEARQMMKEMTAPLTLDDLQQLNLVLAQGLPPDWKGMVRGDSTFPFIYSEGARYNFTPDQLAQIDKNPLVKVDYLDDGDERGHLLYPTTKDPEFYVTVLASLPKDIRDEIITDPSEDKEGNLMRGLFKNFLRRYNEPLPETKEGIIAKAASLQREFVSIHGFADANGRLSRFLMHEYLGRGGLEPTILENGDTDLFYSDEDWEQQVVDGQKKYSELKQKVEQNPDLSQRELMFSRDFLDTFDQVLAPYLPPPSADRSMWLRDYRPYFELIGKLSEEFKIFVDQGEESGLKIGSSVDRVGGLIPSEFIELWGNTRPEVQERVRREFYYGQEVYRGIATGRLEKPSDLLMLFTQVPLEGAAYRPLTLSSTHSPSVEEIRETLRVYNRILASDFFKRASPDTAADPHGLQESEKEAFSHIGNPDTEEAAQKALRDGNYMGFVIQSHKHIGGSSQSPAYPLSLNVSTALDKDLSEDYLRGGNNYNAVHISALLPKHGTYYDQLLMKVPVIEGTSYKYSGYKAFYTPGGIDPNAIMSVDFYDKARKKVGNAKREDNTIVLTDSTRNVVERYVFDEDGRLRLSSQRPFEEADRDSLKK